MVGRGGGRTGALRARCPFTAEQARLWTAHGTHGPDPVGRHVVARTVALANEDLGLLGQAPVVLDEVAAEFAALLDASAAPDGTLPDDGMAMFRAAWSWPEEHMHTRDGELVATAYAAYDLDGVDVATAALDATSALQRHHDPDPDEPGILEWHWRAGHEAVAAPQAAQLGVRWELCEEDAEAPPRRATLQVDTFREELWLFAPTSSRLAGIERVIAAEAAWLLAQERSRHVERLEIVTRWQRERWERAIAEVERRWPRADLAA